MTVDEILAAQDEIMAGAESRELTADEVARYEGLEADLEAARRRDGLAQRHAAARAAVTPALQSAVPAAGTDEDAEYARAFEHYMRTGQVNGDLVMSRAQSEGTGTAGGYMVPETFRAKIQERMLAFGGLAPHVETITTSDGRPMEWVTNDDTGNVGAIVAENGAPAGGADLVFGQKTLGAYVYRAVGAGGAPLKVSRELLMDAAFDVQGMVARKLGERIARAQAPHWVSGSGTGQPLGLITGRTPVEIAAISYANLLTIVHSVDPAYRESGNCRWAFNDATMALVEGLVDGNGRPLLQTSTDGIAGRPSSTLLGYPVTIDQGFGTYVANDDSPAVGAFGDLREGYVIRRVRDVQLIVDPLSFANNLQVGFIAWARADGTQQDTNAYVTFSGAA